MELGHLDPLLALVVVAFLVIAGILAGLTAGRRAGRLEAERQLPELLDSERMDAVRRSRAAVGGQVAEQLAPYLPDFPCDPETVRFVGKPVDFVCFEGAAGGDVREIVFVEVKAGRAALSKTERSVREAIIEGRVRWVEYRFPEA